jgi:hypothetical protein
MARIAAQAITFGQSKVNTTYNSIKYDYHLHPFDSQYGYHFGNDPNGMGQNIGLFAISAIDLADLYNPPVNSSGRQPRPGVKVTISDPLFEYLILSLTVGFQFFLYVLTTFIAARVVVVDDSPFAMARLLRSIVNRLGPSGTIASGANICRELNNEDEMEVIYSVKRYDFKGKRSRVEMNSEDRERAFRQGRYD